MIIHIMQDGTIRDTVEGIVIHNEQFYQVLNNIQNKLNEKKGA